MAAPTTSLPERIGGDRNYDYRFAWVRDISLALATLAMLGDLTSAERFMDWLCTLDSKTDSPPKVLYRIDGALDAPENERFDLAGYAASRPVRTGNRAHEQRQIDSLGYFAECADTYLTQGGRWKLEYTQLIRRVADFTVQDWREPSNGIWELSEPAHYVSGKVMSWVTLERAVRIHERLSEPFDTAPWRQAMQQIHAEVLTLGWSDARQPFCQRYGSDALDASVLLISVMDFLPGDDARMRSTIEAIRRDLDVGGLIARFDARELLRPMRADRADSKAPSCRAASGW